MNRSEATRWLGALASLHQKFGCDLEIRTVKKSPEGKTFGTSFRFSDAESAVKHIEDQKNDPTANFYATLNPTTGSGSSTDKDAKEYLWLPVDIDPIRIGEDGFPLEDQKVPSSLQELNSALEAAKRVELFFTRCTIRTGKPITPAVKATSGNGAHLLYRIEAGSDPKETSKIVKRILDGLHTVFANGEHSALNVDVDTVVYNPSRIWKVYGTQARKGEPTETRPWREAEIKYLNDLEKSPAFTLEQLSEVLERLEVYLSKAPKTKKETVTVTNGETLEVTPSEEWIQKYAGFDLTTFKAEKAYAEAGILLGDGEVFETDDSKFVAVRCPNEAEHSADTGERQAVVFLPHGKVFATFNCFHAHCNHLNGAQTAHDMLPLELVKKHCEASVPVAPIPVVKATGSDAHFESPRVQREKENFPQGKEKKENSSSTETDSKISSPKEENSEEKKDKGKDLMPRPPGIDESWIRSLPEMMVEPDPKNKREILVEGLMKRGEIMTLQAPTKVGKTFQLMHMALAWSHGLEYLGFKATRPLSILFVDPELLQDEGEHRFRWVSQNVLLDTPATGQVAYVNLRGKEMMSASDPWHSLTCTLKELLKKRQFDIIIVDSIYQFQGDRDPNASAEVVRMMNQLKSVTEAHGKPSVIYVHHFAKGNPTLKTGLDRAAGSYAYNAAADSVVVISPHAEKDHYAVEFFLRHHKSPESIVCKVREDIRILDKVQGKDPAQVDTSWQKDVSMGEAILSIMLELEKGDYGSPPVPHGELKLQARKRFGVSDSKAGACIKIMEEEGNIIKHGRATHTTWKLTQQGRMIARGVQPPTVADIPVQSAATPHHDDIDPLGK